MRKCSGRKLFVVLLVCLSFLTSCNSSVKHKEQTYQMISSGFSRVNVGPTEPPVQIHVNVRYPEEVPMGSDATIQISTSNETDKDINIPSISLFSQRDPFSEGVAFLTSEPPSKYKLERSSQADQWIDTLWWPDYRLPPSKSITVHIKVKGVRQGAYRARLDLLAMTTEVIDEAKGHEFFSASGDIMTIVK